MASWSGEQSGAGRSIIFFFLLSVVTSLFIPTSRGKEYLGIIRCFLRHTGRYSLYTDHAACWLPTIWWLPPTKSDPKHSYIPFMGDNLQGKVLGDVLVLFSISY